MSGAPGRLPAVPDDAQQIRAEIERTREHLGATVEQLAARVDVKARARAEAAALAERTRSQVTRVTREQRIPLAAAVAGTLAVISLAIWLRRRR
jgi:Protein of unknown function (DUF3618)